MQTEMEAEDEGEGRICRDGHEEHRKRNDNRIETTENREGKESLLLHALIQ